MLMVHSGQTLDSGSGNGKSSTSHGRPLPLPRAIDEHKPSVFGLGFGYANATSWTANGRGLMALGDLCDSTLCEDCRAIQVLGPECKSTFSHLSFSEMRDNASACRLCKLLVEALEPSWHPAYPHAVVDRKELSSEDQLDRESAAVNVFVWAHPQMPNDATYLVAYLSYAGLDHGLCTIRLFKSQG